MFKNTDQIHMICQKNTNLLPFLKFDGAVLEIDSKFQWPFYMAKTLYMQCSYLNHWAN